jgi:hypothetical protein
MPTGRDDPGQSARRRDAAVAATGYLLLALWATWPLAPQMSDHLLGIDPERFRQASALGMADHYLNLWILTWGAHAIPWAPCSFFDANIFHPLAEALATGEHMLGAWPWFAPLYAATGNPIAAANGLVFLSFVLGGLGMYLLIVDITGRRSAGFVAGIVFAFAPWRILWLVHLQLVGVHLFPFALLWMRRALESPGPPGRSRHRALLGFFVCVLLQALTSYYLAYMCAVMCVGVVPWLRRTPGTGPTRPAGVIVTGTLAAAVLGLLSGPYLRLAESGIVPAGTNAQDLSWLRLASANVPELFVRGSPQYAGAVPVALALIGAWPSRARWRVTLLFVWCAASGLVLGLGPVWNDHPLPYQWLARWVPGFSTMRVPERFIILATLGVAGLAGLGAARLQGGVGRLLPAGARIGRGAVAGAVLVALWIDWLPHEARLALRRFPTLAEAPPVYHWLAEHGEGGPLLEVPARQGGFAAAEQHARSQYFSTLHWLPLLGGYSGYQPAFLDVYAELARRLPEREALQTLVNIVDVSWIVVRTAELLPPQRAAWTEPGAGVERVEELDGEVVFRVTLEPTADWRGHLRARGPETTTFAGLPIAPVPPADRRAVLDVSAPAQPLRPGEAVGVWVEVTSLAATPWPCFAVRADGVVRVWARWLADGEPTGKPSSARIPVDLAAGGTARVPLAVWGPEDPGRYHLEIAVGQEEASHPEAWRAGTRVLSLDVVDAGREDARGPDA